MQFNGGALFVTALIAVLSPLIAEIPIGLRLPMVVVEVCLGIIVGPQVLGWDSPGGTIAVLGYLGLIFLFFLAGTEIDLESVRGRPLSLALTGWGLSAAVALLLGGLLYKLQVVRAPLLVSVALTTTGMGALMPILRDSGELGTRFGTYVVAAGAMGEFGPIVLLSLLMTREHTRWEQTALMLTFVALAILTALLALRPKPPRIVAFLGATMNSTSQLPVRISILVLAFLIVIAERFGLDLILGAFTAGMIVSLGSKGPQGTRLHHRLDAIGYGFLIPMFFVASGMHFDIHALFSSPRVLWRLPLFLLFLFIARSVPIIFYRYELAKEDRLPFVLYSATSLPLMIAIAEIGVQTGRMMPDNAAALVGAGMLSILLFPIMALIARRRVRIPAPVGSTSPVGVQDER
jgi:Kef-type K+ transport system membrane component KefB